MQAGLKAEVYTYTDPKGRPAAMGFSGKKQRPSFHHHYESPEGRTQMLERWFDGVKKDAARKAEVRAARNRPHDLEAGEILVADWGYNQTNVDFFEVTAVVCKNTVELMEIESRTDHDHPWQTGAMCDHVLPCPGIALSGRFRVRVNMAHGKPWVKISNVKYAHRWNGRPQFRSWWH